MPTHKWRDYVIERMRAHPEDIPGYLNACMDEGEATFLIGLKTVIASRFGGPTGLSRKIDLHRVTIQNMLSDHGNPRLDSLGKVLGALGMKLMVGPMDESASKDVAVD
ncbi:MAG: putative addiction module antidote protein [SAR324 cluster bacterium]|nr:putative addiction module antidote protein [SAR324 cluster bacterium]